MTEHRTEPPPGAALAVGPEPAEAGPGLGVAGALPGEPTALVYETGLELEAHSQWWYARHRFFRHRLAMISLVVLFVIFGAGVLANFVAPYSYSDISIDAITRCAGACHPTIAGKHFFGTDQVGRDYFSRVIWGIRTTERVALLVGLLSTVIGTIVGGIAGYIGGWVDNLLMRITDLFLVIPLLAVLLTASKLLGSATPLKVAVLLACLIWTTIARIVRGSFLSLREKEYVEAAKASGSGDLRIMFRHMLPNTIGPILVAATLTTGLAILLESTLSFLGFGIQPPTPSLGSLIADGQSAGLGLWWLVTFPGLVIMLVVLCINFVGDGLRDALDPTQRRVRA
jgi:ABC-type dipeptide/oligopeptide/nickel transport system permease subunit